MNDTRPHKPPFAKRFPSSTLLSPLVEGLVLLLMLASMAHFSIKIYLLPASFSPVLGMCLLGGAISTMIWTLPRHRMLAVALTLLTAGGLLFYHRSQLLYGAQAIWEALSTFWTGNTYFTGPYVLTDPLPPLQHQAAAQTFLGAVLALLALPLGWAMLRLRSFWLTFALTLPWLMPAFLTEVTPDWPAMMLIFACWSSILLSSLAARENSKGGAQITLVALPVSLGVLWAISLLFPQQGYTQPTWAVRLRDELLSLEWFTSNGEGEISLSDSNTEEAAPRLDFVTAGPRQYTGHGILQVLTSQPGSMYLKGQIYQDYTSQAWTGVTPISTTELDPLDGEPLNTAATATITYLTYLGSTAYLPYQTKQVETRLVSPDACVVFPVALREYEVAYTPLEEEPSPDPSLVAYAGVRSDAYDNYLDVPEPLSDFLLEWLSQATEELESSGDELEADATGEYAWALNTASHVAQLLERNAEYDLNTPRTPLDEDFVSYFLQESRRGYCVHFASAATLLLRLHGIPARYVSGYAINVPNSIDTTRRHRAQVLDSNAHAWVEIYLDGYGWYPVEVTPSAATADVSDPDQPSAISEPPTPIPPPTLTPEPTWKPTPTPTPAPALPGATSSMLWPVWLLPILSPVAAVWLLHSLRRRTWRGILEDSNTNAAVLTAYHWFGQLERWGGKASDETKALAQKARFSQHILTCQERNLVVKQFQGEIARLKQVAPFWKRWLLGLMFPVGLSKKAP